MVFRDLLPDAQVCLPASPTTGCEQSFLCTRPPQSFTCRLTSLVPCTRFLMPEQKQNPVPLQTQGFMPVQIVGLFRRRGLQPQIPFCTPSTLTLQCHVLPTFYWLGTKLERHCGWQNKDIALHIVPQPSTLQKSNMGRTSPGPTQEGRRKI